VAHTIQATWEAEIGRAVVLGQYKEKKFARHPSQQKRAGCGGMKLSSQLQQEAKNRRI
jgi:hypothetical protein